MVNICLTGDVNQVEWQRKCENCCSVLWEQKTRKENCKVDHLKSSTDLVLVVNVLVCLRPFQKFIQGNSLNPKWYPDDPFQKLSLVSDGVYKD